MMLLRTVKDGHLSGWDKKAFHQSLFQALEAVSKRADEENDYMAFIKRAGQNEIGRKVKMADLIITWTCSACQGQAMTTTNLLKNTRQL